MSSTVSSTVSAPATTSEAPAGERGDRRWLLVAAVVALPLVVLIVALAQRTWYPTGDLAQAELRMRSMPGDPPLLGAAGRIVDASGRQGNHPGPLMFWVTWPLYVVLGRSAWAFEAATAVVNVAWLSVAVWLVRRRTNLATTAWFGAVLLVLVGGFGLNGLSQPWNPWVALFPFLVLVLALWSVFQGDRWGPVLAVAGGSYALQSHIGYAPLVGPMVLVALAVPLWRLVRARRTSRPATLSAADDGARRSSRWAAVPLAAAVGLGALAWSGPLIDLAINQPNNVVKLTDNFSTPSDPPIGLARGIEVLLQSSNPVGAWTRGGDVISGSVLPGLALLMAWAATSILVARTGRHRDQTTLNLVLAGATVIGAVALSRVFGTVFLYVFRWITVLVALQVFALGWALITLVPAPSPDTRRRLAAGGVVGLVALSAFTAQRIVGQEIPYDQSWRIEEKLAPATAARLDPDRRYLVTWDDTAYLGGIGFGMILDLERRGFTVGAEPRFSAAVEPHRVMCPGSYDAVVTVVTGRARMEKWDQMADAEKVAEVDLREDPTEYDRYLTRFRERFAADGQDLTVEEAEARFPLILLSPGQDPALVATAEELVSNGIPSAVYVTDPAPPSTLDLTSPLNDACGSSSAVTPS